MEAGHKHSSMCYILIHHVLVTGHLSEPRGPEGEYRWHTSWIARSPPRWGMNQYWLCLCLGYHRQYTIYDLEFWTVKVWSRRKQSIIQHCRSEASPRHELRHGEEGDGHEDVEQLRRGRAHHQTVEVPNIRLGWGRVEIIKIMRQWGP